MHAMAAETRRWAIERRAFVIGVSGNTASCTRCQQRPGALQRDDLWRERRVVCAPNMVHCCEFSSMFRYFFILSEVSDLFCGFCARSFDVLVI